jgi:hypothetical protein
MRRKSAFRPAKPFQSLERSVYIGREHLGRFTQIGKTQFEVFDAAGRRLGAARSNAAALAAINKCAHNVARQARPK